MVSLSIALYIPSILKLTTARSPGAHSTVTTTGSTTVLKDMNKVARTRNVVTVRRLSRVGT